MLEQTFTEPQTGRIVTKELEDYLLPVNADAGPSVEPILVAEDDPHVNQVGVKGIGKIGNVGTASGDRQRRLPRHGQARPRPADHVGQVVVTPFHREAPA